MKTQALRLRNRLQAAAAQAVRMAEALGEAAAGVEDLVNASPPSRAMPEPLLEPAPEDPTNLPMYFAALSAQQLRRCWVAAVIQAFFEESGEFKGSRSHLAAVLAEVRDHNHDAPISGNDGPRSRARLARPTGRVVIRRSPEQWREAMRALAPNAGDKIVLHDVVHSPPTRTRLRQMAQASWPEFRVLREHRGEGLPSRPSMVVLQRVDVATRLPAIDASRADPEPRPE
jgi:hypothetical protein